MREREYKKRKFYWGLKPDKDLIEIFKYAPRGVALDIGAGEGRNSIFLAKNRFKVEAIDKIKDGLKKCKEFSKKHNLLIKTKIIDIRKFKFEKNKYSLVVSIATLDFLRLPEIKRIIPKIKKSLKKEGIFYLVVFSIKDPLFKEYKNRKLTTIERNTFYIPKLKTFHHFFEEKEVLVLFKNFKIIKLKKEEIKDYHGVEGTHSHNIIEVIAKK